MRLRIWVGRAHIYRPDIPSPTAGARPDRAGFPPRRRDHGTATAASSGSEQLHHSAAPQVHESPTPRPAPTPARERCIMESGGGNRRGTTDRRTFDDISLGFFWCIYKGGSALREQLVLGVLGLGGRVYVLYLFVLVEMEMR